MEEKEIKIKNQIIELQNQIIEWDKHYYDFDNPVVTDEIYDTAYNKLKAYENQYSYLFSQEELEKSPTNRINAHVAKIFKKIHHSEPMLSLNKTYTIDEIEKFMQNIAKITNNFSFFIEPKIDGLSIAIKYKNGRLFQAITRGNGEIGEDVTSNILQIKNIPKRIDYKKNLEVRGEIFLPIDEFNQINKKLITQNKPILANPRNAASGTIRQLNPEIVKERNLSSFLYYIVSAAEHNIHTMEEAFNFLNKLGFNTSSQAKKVSNLEAIKKYIDDFKNIKKDLNYETDGIVIKLNEMKLYDQLGSTSKFPHWAIAFKYEPDIAITTLKDIFITIGRTGVVTYNASLEEVELSGTKVTFATLNNFEFIKNLNINIGDEVYIKKSGEIIPCVIGVANKKNQAAFEPFEKCPYCQEKIFFNETKLEQFCLNENCPEIKIRKLIHFTSKEALDINSLGEKNIIFLNKLGFIEKIEDIYNLKNHKDKLIALQGFGEVSINKIIASIEESKEKSLEKFIFGFSIPLVGQKAAKFIASKLLKLENVLNFDFGIFATFHDFGEKITSALITWFNKKENLQLINNLLAMNINPQYQNTIKTNILQDISFVITGTLSKPRSHFEKIILDNGGQVFSSISSNIKYLLAGEKAGSKLQKAKKSNVTIINEDEFNQLIKSI
ncbi:NAD-dependent DNA ligase LigA [Metamycoplasma alkalescens]|uniref:DNA ligase n=2 Tax=Metamycoplasma alkalescens TaxID=45363 RepID=A0A318U8J3_9BACT|nr:NAD-dependent DNA ligase LigA [Metamycoplasma alkalescens]PYF43192.1 DNA ligase (NAD+) [Metamycoplasma alkalescens]